MCFRSFCYLQQSALVERLLVFEYALRRRQLRSEADQRRRELYRTVESRMAMWQRQEMAWLSRHAQES